MKPTHTFVVLAFEQSPYLESCIQSVLNQSEPTHVVIATSTPNEYIDKTAQKYQLNLMVNPERIGLGNDFDFALQCVDTDLVTIAHQDDIYDYHYARRILDAYNKNIESDPVILFTDYYEIRNGERVYSDLNLKIKRTLLAPLKQQKLGAYTFFRRSAIRFGSAICCPSVTFVKKNLNFPVYDTAFECDVDWNAWEALSKSGHAFIYVNEPLMGHRVHEASTTSELIGNNIRHEEDYEMFCKFWPKPIARVLANVYSQSEKSNQT
ncbi:MAG: glycosyltransferase [Faecalicoccus sp.]|nr:glycosyltransferase [Faecalicoccus sp.]